MKASGRLMFASVLLFLVTACDRANDKSSSEVEIDGDAVKSQSSALSAAIAAAESDDGLNVAANLASAGNAVAGFIPQTKSAARQQTSRAGIGTTTCTCATSASAAKSCTFDGSCTILGAKVGGTISWADGKLLCKALTFDVGAMGTTQVNGESVAIGATHISVSCDVTYGSGHFDGSLTVTGTAVVNDVSYSWKGTVSAADVTLTSQAFTSGSVDVEAMVTAVSEARGTEDFHASGAVSFP